VGEIQRSLSTQRPRAIDGYLKEDDAGAANFHTASRRPVRGSETSTAPLRFLHEIVQETLEVRCGLSAQRKGEEYCVNTPDFEPADVIACRPCGVNTMLSDYVG